MEINDLKIFQTVAYEKSISKAALKLGYAQSNITMRIKLLENTLNSTLFIRNNKGTTITDDGEKLLKYADKILQLFDEINDEFLSDFAPTTITIGATQTISASILPKLFSLFYAKNPKVSLTLKTEKQDILLDMLMMGELDGAFISGEFSDLKLRKVFAFNEELALISSSPIDDINNLTLPIIINSDINCPYRNLLKEWFIYNNTKPTSVIEFDSLESIISGISEDLGISLLPKSVLSKTNNFFIYYLKDNFKQAEVKFLISRNRKIDTLLKSFINISSDYVFNSH
ncbi:LysR family transcriptional regulator [Inconstantimicrobium mannanitabidum]|uniref:HTH-type transcriptional regulator YusT n=1 Tax=Inconstantimicrobium mannanitabidum TaxID=1604901 RepID=A0ACB5RHR3_9CLOT|nr:LysR family transcriptional regulator [Clostridium sp. TW13]GKX68604.1 putative HTH-type transcriptional regulator YusT [Clostridium sp. TW13]